MRRSTGLLAAAVVALGLPAAAQEKPGVAMQVISARAKAGLEAKYEGGRKLHMDWHKKQADTWSWHTWQIQSGPNSGGYYVTTPGHHWKDFDTWQQKLGKGDEADWNLNVAPYSAEQSSSYWMYMADVSRPGDTAAGPTPMGELTTFRVKPSAAEDFDEFLRKAHEAIVKTNAPIRYYIYALWDGGYHPSYALFIPMKGMADFEPTNPLPAVLEQAYGDKEAGRIMGLLTHSIEKQWSELLQYREDLSYRPAK